LVKPAAVKIARIMHSDAVASKLAMIPLPNKTGNKLLLLRNELDNFFTIGRDYRFRKRCIVHGVGAIPCD